MMLCDLWPDSIVANNLMKKNWLYKILKKLEYWMYHKATSIVILSRQFRDYLRQAGIEDNKIVTSISGVSKEFYPRPKNSAIVTHFNLADKFVIGYIGSFGISHSHHDILLLAESLRSTTFPFHFLLLGDGAKRAELLQQKKDRNLDNVSIDGPFSAECIPDYWSVIDIAIVPLANTPTNKTVLPSKILEALGMGIPIVLYAPDGEARKFLVETQTGWYVPVGDLAALEKKLKILIKIAMKLIIQIPCYNEATTLGITLAALPRQVIGFTQVEWLIIDDGSTDNTVEVAQQHGVDHIIQHTFNQGLANSFMTGINACLGLGADIIVNTDADNQYNAQDIPLLLAAIIEGKADMVIGARPINSIEHFSKIKKNLQKLGSWVVGVVSRTDIPDAPSGFRAISRSAAKRLILFSEYTYTLETIIQAKQKNMKLISVPIRVNRDLRPSRLVKSIPSYVKRSIMTLLRIFVVYRPFRFFGFIAAVLGSIGFFIGFRFLYYYFAGAGKGHIQSLILAAALCVMSFQACLTAFLADIIGANRKLLEDIRCNLKDVQLDKKNN
ncbi:hypothetical protein FQR65_LT11259 [Abscondita terminalis]|nr:hypothetical protein FQR65_LT11259 [Abscondita terminalis]